MGQPNSSDQLSVDSSQERSWLVFIANWLLMELLIL